MRENNTDSIAIVTTLGAQEFGQDVVRSLRDQVKEKVSNGVLEGEISLAETVFRFKKEAKDVLISMASEA
jgi:hypothetical protein